MMKRILAGGLAVAEGLALRLLWIVVCVAHGSITADGGLLRHRGTPRFRP